METAELIFVLVGALFGGAGLKVIEKILDTSDRKNDLARQIRSELRGEVESLRAQIDSIEGRLEKWKHQYYDLLISFNELMAIAMNNGLTDETEHIRARMRKET